MRKSIVFNRNDDTPRKRRSTIRVNETPICFNYTPIENGVTLKYEVYENQPTEEKSLKLSNQLLFPPNHKRIETSFPQQQQQIAKASFSSHKTPQTKSKLFQPLEWEKAYQNVCVNILKECQRTLKKEKVIEGEKRFRQYVRESLRRILSWIWGEATSNTLPKYPNRLELSMIEVNTSTRQLTEIKKLSEKYYQPLHAYVKYFDSFHSCSTFSISKELEQESNERIVSLLYEIGCEQFSTNHEQVFKQIYVPPSVPLLIAQHTITLFQCTVNTLSLFIDALESEVNTLVERICKRTAIDELIGNTNDEEVENMEVEDGFGFLSYKHAHTLALLRSLETSEANEDNSSNSTIEGDVDMSQVFGQKSKRTEKKDVRTSTRKKTSTARKPTRSTQRESESTPLANTMKK